MSPLQTKRLAAKSRRRIHRIERERSLRAALWRVVSEIGPATSGQIVAECELRGVELPAYAIRWHLRRPHFRLVRQGWVASAPPMSQQTLKGFDE